MERECTGVRRQSEAAPALSGGRGRGGWRTMTGRAKAVSRCACHRSPRRAFQLQRSCVIQPSIGAMVAVRKHLRWVNGQNENNSAGVAARSGGDATPLGLRIFWAMTQGRRSSPVRADRQPWAE